MRLEIFEDLMWLPEGFMDKVFLFLPAPVRKEDRIFGIVLGLTVSSRFLLVLSLSS